MIRATWGPLMAGALELIATGGSIYASAGDPGAADHEASGPCSDRTVAIVTVGSLRCRHSALEIH